MTPQITAYIVLAFVVCLTAWDVFAIVCLPCGSSISENLGQAGRIHLVLPLSLGVLTGHCFARLPDVGFLVSFVEFCREYPVVVFLIGMVIGSIFWPVDLPK